MLLNLISTKSFGKEPDKSNICPECREAQVFKWDNAGDGKNIILTSKNHEECYKKYWKNIKEFDYEVTVKSNQLKELVKTATLQSL
jgi:hypothetical protein